MTAGNPFDSWWARALRWLGAAVVVVAVHAGCVALAMMHWTPPEEADDGPGAMVVELAPMPVASPVDTPDIAHGAPSEESQAAQPSVKETIEEEVKTETPPIEPTPTPPPEPEVELPQPKPKVEKEPEKEKPKEEKMEASDRASEASIAAAPPRVEAPKAEIPVPTKGASAAQVQRVRSTWERALVTHLSRHKRYPSAARARRHQGSVSVRFTMDREGRVITTRVVHSSGSDLLDDEATAVLRRSSPLPKPPSLVPGATFDLTLPIQFRIR